MPPLARDPTTLVAPSGIPGIRTLPELIMLRDPGEKTIEALFEQPTRRELRDAETRKVIRGLELPNGAAWIVTADNYADLGRHRRDCGKQAIGERLPVFTTQLGANAPRLPGTGIRMAVLDIANSDADHLAAMVERCLDDDSLVGAQLANDSSTSSVRMVLLKADALEILIAHGFAQIETEDVPASRIYTHLERLDIRIAQLEELDESLDRLLKVIGKLARHPVKGIIVFTPVIAGLIAASLRGIGVL